MEPREVHISAVKRVVWYAISTTHGGTEIKITMVDRLQSCPNGRSHIDTKKGTSEAVMSASPLVIVL